MPVATWQGTEDEFQRLARAIARHCGCMYGGLDLPARMCVAHLMLVDQNTLDHLLYVYRTRSVFCAREFSV